MKKVVICAMKTKEQAKVLKDCITAIKGVFETEITCNGLINDWIMEAYNILF
jgi:hypothetical protein